MTLVPRLQHPRRELGVAALQQRTLPAAITPRKKDHCTLGTRCRSFFCLERRNGQQFARERFQRIGLITASVVAIMIEPRDAGGQKIRFVAWIFSVDFSTTMRNSGARRAFNSRICRPQFVFCNAHSNTSRAPRPTSRPDARNRFQRVDGTAPRWLPSQFRRFVRTEPAWRVSNHVALKPVKQLWT